MNAPFPKPAHLIPATEGRTASRYEVSRTLNGETQTERTDSFADAEAEYERFARDHAADKQALFGIYDFKMLRTVTNWRGGKPHGPVDLAHPMERMIRRARLAGQKTFVGVL